ncbi:MAG: SDR family oxidoreductase [Pseudomonadota bacterium]|nr:SDR family oxidoreductase [Pseudomonadota bacterium]
MSDVFETFRLTDRTAIVMGIGPGVGEHVAKGLAAAGARVVCAARRTANIERVAREIREAGGEAIPVTADVTVSDDLERLVAESRRAFGPIHVLFHNATAGVIPMAAGVWGNTPDIWQSALAANVTSVYRLAELVYPDMATHGRGSIITVGSTGGFTPVLPSIAYGVAKAGLVMLTRHLAKALAPAARVNMICIGSMTPDGVELEAHKGYEFTARNAIKRYGHAKEAVGVALLLASDASSYTTGSTIFVEGGRVGTQS